MQLVAAVISQPEIKLNFSLFRRRQQQQRELEFD
jgi:hypothetical protein